MKFIDIVNGWLEAIKEYPILLNDHKELLDLYTIATDEIDRLAIKINQLESKDEINEQLLNKYPSKKITWPGRSAPFSKDKIKVPVQVLITPNDPFIIEDLKRWGLYQTGEDYETLIPKIYKKIYEKYYKYMFDKERWGEEEVWEFPFELREMGFNKGYDCDSWSHFQVSYFRASGIPYWKVWVEVGKCLLGGHSTVKVYSDVTERHHHLNSTYGGMLFDKISEYPTSDNPGKLGITDVWLSFNDKSARSTRAAKEVEDLLKTIRRVK